MIWDKKRLTNLIESNGDLSTSDVFELIEELLAEQKQLIKDELGKLKVQKAVFTKRRHDSEEIEKIANQNKKIEFFNEGLDQAINLIDKI